MTEGRPRKLNSTAALDLFQNAFAAYLAGNLPFGRLRRTVSDALAAKPHLAQAISRSVAAAFAADCLAVVDYRVLKADIARLRVSQRHRTREGASRPVGPGSVLRKRFEIVERAANGGIGILFRAIDHRRRDAGLDASTVAIKMLSEEFRHCPQALKTLQSEARNAQYLSHRNIRAVYDIDQCEAGMFVTMEWLEGESLARRLDRTGTRAMPFPAAARVLGGVAAGLAHAHSRGIVHGDVKPANVFVTVDGGVKLLDFSQANVLGGHRQALGKQAISPGYASCELHEGARPEIRDDIFALAVMAYRILAGARPFGRYTPLEAEQAGIRALRPAGMRADQWRVLQQGLGWRRAQRPDDVERFIAGLLADHNPGRGSSLTVAA